MLNRKLKIKVTLNWYENKSMSEGDIPHWRNKDTEYLLFEVDSDSWQYGTLMTLAFHKVKQWIADNSCWDSKYEIVYHDRYPNDDRPTLWYEIVYNYPEHSIQEEIDSCLDEVSHHPDDVQKAYDDFYRIVNPY